MLKELLLFTHARKHTQILIILPFWECRGHQRWVCTDAPMFRGLHPHCGTPLRCHFPKTQGWAHRKETAFHMPTEQQFLITNLSTSNWFILGRKLPIKGVIDVFSCTYSSIIYNKIVTLTTNTWIQHGYLTSIMHVQILIQYIYW